MAFPEPLAQSITALSRFFVGDGTLQETLDRVAHLAQQAVPDAGMTAITMLVEGRTTTAVFTDQLAPELDQAQYDSGIGPCLDAFRHKKVFRIHDTEKDQQFPQFSEAAAAAGVRSVLSLPLVANHEGVGALNLYSQRPSAFSDDQVKLSLALAAQAAIVLANAQAYWDAYQLSQDLNEAMRSRATIEQAKGILMGAQRCGADEAFQMLVRASQRENRKLREIADEIVGRAARPRSGS
jgi:GAF domain-containing protein